MLKALSATYIEELSELLVREVGHLRVKRADLNI